MASDAEAAEKWTVQVARETSGLRHECLPHQKRIETANVSVNMSESEGVIFCSEHVSGRCVGSELVSYPSKRLSLLESDCGWPSFDTRGLIYD